MWIERTFVFLEDLSNKFPGILFTSQGCIPLPWVQQGMVRRRKKKPVTVYITCKKFQMIKIADKSVQK